MKTRDSDPKPKPGKNLIEERVLLALLPFWTPLIPPMGIACLKSYLRQQGCSSVYTADANIEKEFKEIYYNYFNTLRESIPGNKQGNFYSIGQDVLHNHMMAHQDFLDENEYMELVKILIEKTFFITGSERCISQLNKIIARFYVLLEQYILHLLEKNRPTVLGLSVCSGTLPASLFAFKVTRKHDPNIKTVMGGGIFCDQFAVGTPNFEILLEKTKKYIDKFIVGEGEILLLKFLKGELSTSQRAYTFRDIQEGSLDLETVGIPDFMDFDLRHYPYLSAYTSRSCPYQCKFCSDTVMWGKYRKKKATQIVRELVTLYKKHGYQLFMMSDLLLNPIITELAEELLESDVAIYWDGCLKIEKHVCSPQKIRLWRRGGFYRARIGCESGSQRVLQAMNKKISVEQIKKAISTLASAGIQTTTYWITGYPGETEEDFQQTLDLITELQDDIYEAECRPFYYYLSGQVNSDTWSKNHKRLPLYPKKMIDMLSFQTWLLDCEPSREENYRRVNRFVQHCQSLGIPNPYTLKETYEADLRWKIIHQNAVPSLVDLKNKDIYIDECKHAEEYYLISDSLEDQGDFNF